MATVKIKKKTLPIKKLNAISNRRTKEEYSKEILNLIKNESMWCFTGSLYLPKRKEYFSNGVIVQDRPQIQEGIIMDKSELVKKLKNGKKVKGEKKTFTYVQCFEVKKIAKLEDKKPAQDELFGGDSSFDIPF